MAIIYVDSVGGSNTSPYDTWAKAAILFQTALTQWSTGDVIWMEQDHTETVAATITYSGGTIAEPIPTYRMDNSDDSYAPASVTEGTKNLITSTSNDTMTFQSIVLFGVHLEVNGIVTSPASHSFKTYDCVLLATGNLRGLQLGQTNGDGTTQHNNFKMSSTTGQIVTVFSSITELHNFTVSGTIAANGFIQPINNRACTLEIYNSDWGGITTGSPIMVDTSAPADTNFKVDFINPSFPSGFSLTDGSFGNDNQCVTVWGGGVTDLFPVARETFRGVVESDTVTFRDAGYVDADGDTNLSHSLTANADTIIQSPLHSFELLEWRASTGTVSVTVEVVENYTTALQDDEAWMEVQYLDTTGNEFTLVSTQVKAVAGTSLSAGTGLANWTGEPASSRSVKFEVTGLTIGREGWIKAKIFLGKFESTKEFFVDPMMTIA